MQNTTQNNLEGLWIDINILKDSNLSLQEKFTLAIIKALDKNNGCFASNKYFAEILQVTPKRASDIIQSLITKNYITSIIEDRYKRTLHIAIPQQEEQQEQAAEDGNVIPFKSKNKPLMWRGYNLSTLTQDALERLKKRFHEVEMLLNGETVDENQPVRLRVNDERENIYKEATSEWAGINQLQFT